MDALTSTFDCRGCGRRHALPFAYAASTPARWSHRFARGASELGAEHCVVDGRHFLVRGVLRLPVLEVGRHFEWGVWAEVSAEDFLRMDELWDVPGREDELPVEAWLASELPTYRRPTTGLYGVVVQRPVGLRPWLELAPSVHQLSVEQREGITLARVREIAEALLHPSAARAA